MKVNILTPDSKQPNLASMKISAWHKAQGDEVELNFPLLKGDFTYASVLFNWTPDPHADLIGGSKYPHSKLDPEIDNIFPDYSIYPKIDFSLGYTYKACPRSCDFCVVPQQKNEEKHYSIWSFHNHKFKKICLLNNNTLADPYWRDTFNEILDAKLTLIEHGFDARFITEEVADYLSKIKFDRYLHIAWDYLEHEQEILTGIVNLKKYLPHIVRQKRIICYVLIGHTNHQENIHRVMKLKNMQIEPFVMPLDKHDDYQRDFSRWVNHKAIFKTVSWDEYKKQGSA